MSDDEFLAGFEGCTLARPEWTHEAHVRMAWLYLRRYSLAEATELVRKGIRRLNATFTSSSCWPKRNAKDGSHDTITVAFLRLIAARFRSDDDFPTFRALNPDLFDRTLSALLYYYTKERLHSAEARRIFIEPDVKELPL
jgi:hypothetical protein